MFTKTINAKFSQSKLGWAHMFFNMKYWFIQAPYYNHHIKVKHEENILLYIYNNTSGSVESNKPKVWINLSFEQNQTSNNSTLRYECDETFSDECEFAPRAEGEWCNDFDTRAKKRFFARVSYEILYHEVWNKPESLWP